jgi:DNA-binding NarL/FixJ family response regulator
MTSATDTRPGKIRIMMVDDHPIMREGMALFLDAQPDLHLCHQAGTAEEALAALASARPALVIVDISLHRESGLDLIKALRRRDPALALLALSLHDESVFAERALQAGANGYLMKQEATSSILRAIRKLLAGEIYLSAAMHGRLGRSAGPSPITGISEREFEILHLIALGFSTRQISAKLSRSIKTIEAHRASLKEKLQLDSGADLLRFAARWLDERPPA